MYAQQANTGIAPLDAVLATAQMVTPDGGNTVAAQVAQAAAQKMQPQGIMGGMPQARQDFRTAAEIDNMKRMQMQQAMQQMAAQMTARPAGIEGLPAQNMQTFAAAQGGVVGYASRGYVDPQLPEVYEPYVETSREERTGREEEELFGPMKTERQRAIEAAEEELLGPTTRERLAAAPPRPAPANRPSAPAPRPPAPAPRPPAPVARPPAAGPAPTGIAALADRPQYDVASIPAAGAPYMKAGEEDVARLRKAEGERAAFEKTLPDLSAKGIEALQQRMRDVEAAEAARKESAGLDRVIQQLLGRTQGAGGAARADIQFMNAQNAAADAFSQARLGNQQAQLLLEKAQQERQLGRFDRAIALEKEASALMEKARDNRLKAEEIAQRSAGAQFQGAVQMRGQDITERTAAADRATQLQIARIQAAARNDPQSKEAMAMARVQQAINSSPMLKALAEQAKFDPSAAARYRVEEEALYKRVAPELFGGAGAAPAAASNDPLGLRR